MKYFLMSTVLFLFIQSQSFAQQETRIGGFLAYGTEVESLGIGANAEFPIMEKLTISPAFIYYFPKDSFGLKVTSWELNANANYYFLDEGNIGIYGLAGLNYSNVSVKFDNPFFDSESASNGRVGLNLGGGANFNFGGSITPFAELKYVIIDGGQLVLAGGVKFNL